MRLPALLVLAAAAQATVLLPATALRFQPAALELGVRTLASLDTAVWVVNQSAQPVQVSELLTLSGRLQVGDLAELPAGDSLRLPLRLDLRDDLDLREVLQLRSPQLAGLPGLSITAQPRHPDPDWAGAANLWGTALKSFLGSRVTGHTVYSYTSAREHMFGEYDNVNGQVQCVYTASWVTTDGIPDGSVMNCEHTWPQSLGAEGDARSDMHHLFPTLSSPNSVRGNLPFGDVVTQNWAQGGSLRGTDAGGVTVFEPRDPHKGDCARACFYFALRYGNLSSFLTYQEPVLRQWAFADTVSQKELDRNAAIDALQHNRNPFIDHNGWLGRIASLAGSADPAPTRLLSLAVDSLALGEVAAGDSVRFQLPLLNTGNATLLVGYVQSSQPADLHVLSAPTSLAAGQLGWAEFSYHPGTAVAPVEITVSTNAQNGALRQVAVTGGRFDTALEPAAPRPAAWRLVGAAPNPFNPATRLTLELDQPAELALSVYDSRGARVLEWHRQLPAGHTSLPLDLSGQPSGRYWLRLEVGGHAETLPLTLLK
ncbi:MAG: endonuclease [Candidatus Delongbacteria bacterium]